MTDRFENSRPLHLLRGGPLLLVLVPSWGCSSDEASNANDSAANSSSDTSSLSAGTQGSTTQGGTTQGTAQDTTQGTTMTTGNGQSTTTGSAGTDSTGAGGSGGGTTVTEGTISTSGGGFGGASSSEGTTTGGSELEPFSFFATSLEGLQRLSGSQDGFGGDLRYTEDNGLAGADKICHELAETSMPGSGAKGWRAFLSTSEVNAIDRVGEGPWYDRLGRTLAMTKGDLLNTRPVGADPAIVDDLPNEYGVPNQQPDPNMPAVDNHHFLTGSDENGELYGSTSHCNDWTSTEQSAGRPRVGFSWPASNRSHWISGQDEGGCGAGIVLTQMGGSDPSNPIVGSGGGYGGFYCFALTP